jgi:predicted nucleotide-binding protein
MEQLNSQVARALTVINRQRSALDSISDNFDVLIPQWRDRTTRMLRDLLIDDELRLLANAQAGTWGQEKATLNKFMIDLEIGVRDLPEHYLLLTQLEALPSTAAPSVDQSISSIVPSGHSVFVVHGHDALAKSELARTLEKLKLTAIVLHEQENEGKTIIEKFERDASRVSFAVVLFTPDDVGHAQGKPDTAKPRARQNVVLELGYFCGALGRSKVCVLHKGDVEIPTDYLGVVYTKMDDSGAWRFELAKELKRAGLPIDMNNLA